MVSSVTPSISTSLFPNLSSTPEQPVENIVLKFSKKEQGDGRHRILHSQILTYRTKRSSIESSNSLSRSNSLETIPIPQEHTSWKSYLKANGIDQLCERAKSATQAIKQHFQNRISDASTKEKILNCWGDSVMHIRQLKSISQEILIELQDETGSLHQQKRSLIQGHCISALEDLEEIVLENLRRFQRDDMAFRGGVSEFATPTLLTVP